jgi:hypothetical protein
VYELASKCGKQGFAKLVLLRHIQLLLLWMLRRGRPGSSSDPGSTPLPADHPRSHSVRNDQRQRAQRVHLCRPSGDLRLGLGAAGAVGLGNALSASLRDPFG